MEPVTHLLASYTLARATRTPTASPRMGIFLAAGLAPDVDWFFHLPGQLSPVRAYGAAGHSLAAAAGLAAAIGTAGWAATRGRGDKQIALGAAMSCAFAATGTHLLLDLCSNYGMALLEPFRAGRVAWNLAGNFDPILVTLLAACALLPGLLRMVMEEIGAGRESRPSIAWPIAAVALSMLYLGGRALLHNRAEEKLGAAQYQGASPRRWAAYPEGVFPLTWRGVVETDAFLAEVEVPVGANAAFDTRRAIAHFKPDSSPVLDAAAASELARAYAALARFPVASLEQTSEGNSRVELRELGDSAMRTSTGVWLASIELDAQNRVVHQEMYFLTWRST